VQIVVSVSNFSHLAEIKPIFQQLFHSFCAKLQPLIFPIPGIKKQSV